MIPAIILAHTILGPLGWTLASSLINGCLAGLTGPFKAVFGAIFGALYAPFVITGLHHMTNAIDTQLIADAGGTGLWPMIALLTLHKVLLYWHTIYEPTQRKGSTNFTSSELFLPTSA